MAGIVEDQEPEGAAHIRTFAITRDPSGVQPPPLELEALVDRLRFMGLDQDVVVEAGTRLRADVVAGMTWLKEQLRELEPPRRPPQCDCGEQLVDIDWRGRATVRCSACGSRWGVEVIDEETESLWAISGPSEEWRQSHPIEDDDLYGEFQPEDVLSAGLPPFPTSAIESGTCFPLAFWKDERHAAVLYVHRVADPDSCGDEYEHEVEHLLYDCDEGWIGTGSDGGNWVNVFDPPRDLLEKYVVFSTGVGSVVDGDEEVSLVGGMCSATVAAVEATDGRGARIYSVETARPFFLVGIYGRGRIRLLGQDGAVVNRHDGTALEIDID